MRFHLVALSIVTIAGCRQAMAPPPPPPAKVTVQIPVHRKIPDAREYTGRIHAMEIVEVRARVKGYLQKVRFTEGAFVEAGKLLYEIDPSTFEADLEKAKAEVARAQTQLNLTTSEYNRVARLRPTRTVTEEEYEQRKAAMSAAGAALEQAKSAVRSAELEIGFTKIKAKIDGKIGRTLVTEGNLVGYNDPTLLTTIVKLDPVHVFFEETEHGLEAYDRLVEQKGLKTLAEAKIPIAVGLAWEKGFPHSGKLDFRDNKIDPGTGTIQLRGEVPNQDGKLTPGQFVRVRVAFGEPRDRLLIPEQAVINDQQGRYVLLVKSDGMVEQRFVETGLVVDGLTVVEKGVQPEDRVIVTGLQRARPGSKVEVISPEAKAPETKGAR